MVSSGPPQNIFGTWWSGAGQTVAIGTWLAAAGGAFAFLSPILGWLGTAVTGSDTSANALFATLQQTAGHQAGIDPTLLVGANSSGGVVGKLIAKMFQREPAIQARRDLRRFKQLLETGEIATPAKNRQEFEEMGL